MKLNSNNNEQKNHLILANTVPNNYTLNTNCKINNSSQTFSHTKYRKLHRDPQANKLNYKKSSIRKKIFESVYCLQMRKFMDKLRTELQNEACNISVEPRA